MRVVLAVALLVGCCTLDAVSRFRETIAVLRWWGKGDHVSRATARFEAIRPKLPAHGVVGYRFHGKESDVVPGKMLPQYHLAPLIVRLGATTNENPPTIMLDDDGTEVRVTTSTAMPETFAPINPTPPMSAMTIVWLIVAWGIPCFAVYCVLRAGCESTGNSQTPSRSWAWTLWLIGLSWGAGLGISSALFALWNILCGPAGYFYWTFESVVWGGLLLFARNLKSRNRNSTGTGDERLLNNEQSKGSGEIPATVESGHLGFATTDSVQSPVKELASSVAAKASFILLLIAVGLSLIATTWECVIWNERCPHGVNDAVMIWNLRARFLHRLPGDWGDAFSPLIWHADYPLLLPASVARAWNWIGGEVPAIPAIIGDLYLFTTVMILASSLNLLRGITSGCLIALIVLCSRESFMLAISQIADLPFAYCVAATITSWVMARRWPAIERTAWLAVGLSIGSALWLKNEGLTWAAMGFVILFIIEKPRWSRRVLATRWMPLTVSGGLFLIAWATFHACFPIANDLVAAQGSSTASRLGNIARHGKILSHLAIQFFQTGPIILAAITVYSFLMGRVSDAKNRRDLLGPTILLVGQLVVYYLVYLTSPHNLNWHLGTSADRVLFHLWPSAAWLMFLIVRSPCERLSYDAAREQERLETEAQLHRS